MLQMILCHFRFITFQLALEIKPFLEFENGNLLPDFSSFNHHKTEMNLFMHTPSIMLTALNVIWLSYKSIRCKHIVNLSREKCVVKSQSGLPPTPAPGGPLSPVNPMGPDEPVAPVAPVEPVGPITPVEPGRPVEKYSIIETNNIFYLIQKTHTANASN